MCAYPKLFLLSPFDPFSLDLPITEVIDEVRETLAKENTLVISAPPGAGKSTVLPLALLEEDVLAGKKILMLEPRRIAAKTIAKRMSDLLGEPLGQRVGYRIRFENKISEHTKIEVLTEGILTRMLQGDNALENVGLIIFDEFHERSIHADLALALCRESQKILRPDLRIMLMSATLDIPGLKELLKAPIIESRGRQFPVEIIHTFEQDDQLLPEMTAATIKKAIQSYEGDILAFLPGQAEIHKCEEILKRQLKGIRIHPLYGRLSHREQMAAIFPHNEGKRKVVLATSIAETSLTIEGVHIVVDCGFTRIAKFDPNSGLSRLETVQISKDAADQRTGRAGRLGPGVCYRMWTPATESRMAAHRVPEIEVADLASLVLDLACWGISDPGQLLWFTPPPKGTLSQASKILHDLNALEGGVVTAHGRKMHQLPCHPRLAHMLLVAEENENLALATDIAAILEERDPLPKNSGIDINIRIEALRKHRAEKRSGGSFSRIDKVAASYRVLFDIEPENEAVDDFETGVLLAQAYPERIASARPGNNAQFQMANGRLAMAGHKDDLAHESWLAIAHLNAGEAMGKIFMASPLNPRDLVTFVKETEVAKWDWEADRFTAAKELRIGNILLQSKEITQVPTEKRVAAISEAIRQNGEQLLDFNERVVQWQNRVTSLRQWNPEENWPNVTQDHLLAYNREWLGPFLPAVSNARDLRKLDLVEILNQRLSYPQQEALRNLAPEKIAVPSGSYIRLMYSADGAPPILSVRLQEVFGLLETPKINKGKTTVLLHLLSPGFKPVQVTADLRGFWERTYYEVKKDLKRRYPKHAWPEDPFSAEAQRGVKRK